MNDNIPLFNLQLVLPSTEKRTHCFWCEKALVECATCHGSGSFNQHTCLVCHGGGIICPKHGCEYE